MTGLFHNLIPLCLLTAVLSDTVSPPENVTLSWRDGLYPQLSWTHPSKSSCTYVINYTPEKRLKDDPVEYENKSSPWTPQRSMNGGFVNVTIQTVCGDHRSEAVSIVRDDPDLHLSCEIKSSSLTRCSWKPPPSANLSFFYKLAFYKGPFDNLRECPRYNSMRTSCDLQVSPSQALNALLNGTLSGGTLSDGTLSAETLSDGTIHTVIYYQSVPVRLAAPNLTVKESKDKFFLSWTQPDFSYLKWKYNISYTFCNTTSSNTTSKLDIELKRVDRCPYNISMRGVAEYSGHTAWTPPKYYDAVSGMNPMTFAVILIPVVLAVIVILTLLWWKKNKDKVFPQVPQPNPELFKDLMDNNNKINATNFYVPKVVEECTVTLVDDSKQQKL